MSVIFTTSHKFLIQKKIQNIISAYSIFCDLKEIAKKQNLDQRENYPIYGMFLYKQIKVFDKQSKRKISKLSF